MDSPVVAFGSLMAVAMVNLGDEGPHQAKAILRGNGRDRVLDADVGAVPVVWHEEGLHQRVLPALGGDAGHGFIDAPSVAGAIVFNDDWVDQIDSAARCRGQGRNRLIQSLRHVLIAIDNDEGRRLGGLRVATTPGGNSGQGRL